MSLCHVNLGIVNIENEKTYCLANSCMIASCCWMSRICEAWQTGACSIRMTCWLLKPLKLPEPKKLSKPFNEERPPQLLKEITFDNPLFTVKRWALLRRLHMNMADDDLQMMLLLLLLLVAAKGDAKTPEARVARERTLGMEKSIF